MLASQISSLTGGEDGLSFQLPPELRPAFRLLRHRSSASPSTDGILSYYLIFFVVLAMFLVLLRIVNSPFGRVLQAIRENEFRAEAIGYRVVAYRVAASVISALAATVAGALLALWLRYNGPDTTLSFSIMIDMLLMVVIGGMGTLYGAVLGATLFVLAQSYLQVLMAARATGSAPGPAPRRTSPIPTAGCSGSAFCSSSASMHSPAASSAAFALEGHHKGCTLFAGSTALSCPCGEELEVGVRARAGSRKCPHPQP